MDTRISYVLVIALLADVEITGALASLPDSSRDPNPLRVPVQFLTAR